LPANLRELVCVPFVDVPFYTQTEGWAYTCTRCGYKSSLAQFRRMCPERENRIGLIKWQLEAFGRSGIKEANAKLSSVNVIKAREKRKLPEVAAKFRAYSNAWCRRNKEKLKLRQHSRSKDALDKVNLRRRQLGAAKKRGQVLKPLPKGSGGGID
jgi:hypothetical protein